VGFFNDRPSYKHESLYFYLWWSEAGIWFLSQYQGLVIDAYWQRVDEDPVGEYEPCGNATGVATITKAS
jgi:hypothetical protein